MKKLISLALCLAMVLSIFTINASALVETGKTVVSGGSAEVVYVNQQFDGTDTTNFVGGTVANEVSTISTGESTAVIATADDAIPSGQFTFEFDMRKNANYTSTANGSLVIYFTRGGADKGIRLFLSPYYLTAGTWYTYRFVVDETQYAGADNAPNQVTYLGYKEKSAEDYTVLTAAGATAPKAADKYRIRTYGSDKLGDIEFDFAAGMDVSLDNIKIYQPEVAGVESTVTYPINNDMIMGTYTTEYTHTLTEAPAADTTTFRILVDKQNTTEDVVIYADLKNSGEGTYPISVAIGSNQHGASAHILATNDIKDAWYTYKICYKNDVKLDDGGNNWRILPISVYRKPEAGGEWTLLTEGTDWIQGDANNGFSSLNWNGDNRLTGRLQIGYESALTGYTAADTTWNSKNVQVIDACAVTGTKTIADGKINLNLNTGSCGAATAILAVYDGNVLADVDYVTPAVTAETATLTADYAEGNTVTLYVWDSLGNAKPINLEPLTIVE